MPQFFSIQEAAVYLDVDYKVVYRLVREGKIPSTRVGWQFRITQEGLNAYLNAERAKQESTAQHLRAQSVTVAAPREDGVGAGRAHFAGGGPIGASQTAPLVDKVRARQLEQNFISRFQKQIEEIESMRHPTTGALLNLADWERDLVVDEDREGLMRALNSAFLDRKTLATTPRNTYCRYTVKTSPPFVLEARFFAHLATFCRTGGDAAPASADELQTLIQTYAAQHGALDRTVVVGIASPSGWSEAAIAAIDAQDRNPPSGALTHFLLVDLRTNSIHCAQHDTVAAGFAALYQNALALEDVAALREKLLAALEGRAGLLLAEVSQQWGVEVTFLEDAANTLVADGGVRLVPDKTDGWILVRV
jgi:excisionase family DNA binding protein